MDIRQLEYFVELVKEKNFRKASEKLHLSQPALSKSIRLLETELDTTLIARTNKSFELTDTGKVLFQKAVFIIQQFNDIYRTIEDVRLANEGEIRIGVPNMLGSLCYFDLICEFQQKYPGITISVSGEGTKDISDALREERIDLGIGMLSENVPIPKDLRVLPLTHDEAILVVNKGKAYAEMEEVDIHELKDEPFVITNEQYLLYDDFMQICMQAGFTPNVTVKSSQWDYLLRMVSADFGISVLPRPVVEHFLQPNITGIKIKDGFNWDIGFFYYKNKPRTHAMELFMDFTKDYLEKHGDFDYIYFAHDKREWAGEWDSNASRTVAKQ